MEFTPDTTAPFPSSRRSVLKGMTFALFAAALAPLLPASSASAADANLAGKKTLIVYYSRSGNTRQVAGQIQKTIPADVVELKTLYPYPADHRETSNQAKRELAEGYRPPLSTRIDNLNDYEVIIIGSPNWWATLAMPVFTFLDSCDLSGKTVALYITHEGSRLGRSMDDLKKTCPNATILEGLAIRGGDVGSSQGEVNAWLRRIGLAQ